MTKLTKAQESGTSEFDFKIMITEFMIHNDWIKVSPIPIVFPKYAKT